MKVQGVYDAALARGAGTREKTHRRNLELERKSERGIVEFEGPIAGIREHPALRVRAMDSDIAGGPGLEGPRRGEALDLAPLSNEGTDISKTPGKPWNKYFLLSARRSPSSNVDHTFLRDEEKKAR